MPAALFLAAVHDQDRADVGDSDVADLRNIGKKGEAGTIIGGLFLEEFAGGLPWAHLDIAAPAFVDGDDGWIVKGATGWGVRTLVEFGRWNEVLDGRSMDEKPTFEELALPLVNAAASGEGRTRLERGGAE